MFEIGRKYVVTTLEAEVGPDVQKWAVYVIEDVDGALIRARSQGREIVFNTLSPKFVSAELLTDDSCDDRR